MRLKFKYNKIDVAKKRGFTFVNAFFVVDVNSKFSRKKIRFFQHINEKRSYVVEFIDNSFIKTDEIYGNLNVFV